MTKEKKEKGEWGYKGINGKVQFAEFTLKLA